MEMAYSEAFPHSTPLNINKKQKQPPHGKNICKQLKEVRKRIAEENEIPLEIEECTYKGECRGTCPRCEAEVRYLENALADRPILGQGRPRGGCGLGPYGGKHRVGTRRSGAADTAHLHQSIRHRWTQHW